MANGNDGKLDRNGLLVGRKFVEFFLPSVMMAASISLSLIVDSIIVSNILGDDALAAVNLILPITLCYTAVSGMFGIGSASCISMLKGRMDGRGADKCLTLSCIAWALVSLIGVLLGLFCTWQVSAFLSGDSGLTELVADYLRVYLLGSPFTFVTLIFPYIIKADGQPRLSSTALVIANVTNLCLDVVYMRGFGMGIEGAALATITGNAVGTALYLIYVFSKGRTLHFVKLLRADLRLYGDMFRMSVSSIFGQALMFAKMWIFNMIVTAAAGQAGLAAFSICSFCLSFVSMFIAGGAQTMMPTVSAFNGAKDYNDIVAKYGLAATRDFLKEADPFHDAESDAAFWARVHGAFSLIASNPDLKDGDDVLQISHGNTLLSLMHRFAPEGYDLSERPANGSVTCLDFDTTKPFEVALTVVSCKQ